MDTNGISSLMYVSRKTRPGPEGSADLAAILSVSRSRNKALNVTGALVSAVESFAQFIEGPPQSVEDLMNSIRKDSRHTDVQVVSTRRQLRRRFPDWTMAYCRGEDYINRHIMGLVECAPRVSSESVGELEVLMRQFRKRLV